MIANALDRMSGGADDNSAQANHLVAKPLLAHPHGGRISPDETLIPTDLTISDQQRDRRWPAGFPTAALDKFDGQATAELRQRGVGLVAKNH